MVLLLVLLIQTQAPSAIADTLRPSVYSTPALKDFVGRASIENRIAPPSLKGYHATVETELGLILRDSLGRELMGQVEQLAARAEWERNGRYELHVVGFRSLTAGAPYSALSWTKMYTVPTLYGNRMVIGMNDGIPRSRADTLAARRRLGRDTAAGRDRFRAVHPLAVDRDDYYRFTGGDTIANLYVNDRVIRLVRVHVEPTRKPSSNFGSYEGEMDIDADRHQLVRMRGRLVHVTNEKQSVVGRGLGAIAVAYVEFENVEVNGRYWLPAYQRSEFQAQLQMMGAVRPIYRIVSRFRDYAVDADSLITIAQLDTMPRTRAKITFASKDSVSKYGQWQENLGTASKSVDGDDFDDLAPDWWKPTGPPRFDPFPRQLEEMFRFNRVEGMFTGVSGTILFRDMMPGLVARGNIGWAWAEQTPRGSGSITFSRGQWVRAVRVERTLASTNDFIPPLESGLSIGPLFSGVDDHDYVDRRIGAVTITRIVRDVDRALVTTEAAYVQDREVTTNVTTWMLGSTRFRPNRSALPGSYARGTVTLEWHPGVSTGSLSSGFGGRLQYQIASGEQDWQRIEARLAARKYWRGVVFASQIDAGTIVGSVIPPQQLYELGGAASLASYDYKIFGGDRAALGRALAAYHFPVLRTPRRVLSVTIPGLSPGLGAGVHGGWAEASSTAARQALLALGGNGVTPISQPTGTVRATADFRFTILSGAIGAGIARPIDQAGKWKPFFVWGAAF